MICIGPLAHGTPVKRVSLLQIDPAPILRASLHPGARRPGDARFVDVFPGRGIALVAIVDDQVETQPLDLRGRHSNFAEGDGRLDAVTVRRSSPDRKSTRLNSSHLGISYAVFC